MHDRKKGGVRKDKKNERMRESTEMRHELHDARPERPTNDQKDVVPYKKGSHSDHNRTTS